MKLFVVTQVLVKFKGPVHVFNAKLGWSAPKTIELKRRNGGYGFSVIGSAPVIIQSVENDGPAKVTNTIFSQRNILLTHPKIGSYKS